MHQQRLVFLLFTWLLADNLQADWPGHLGPTRDSHASADASLPTASTLKPKTIWQLPAGDGYAGAAISKGQAALYDRKGSKDQLRLVQFVDGEEIWKYEYDASYASGVDSDKGPRCVPQMLDDRILIYSAAGELHCVDRAKGDRIWMRAIRKEVGADDGYFGAGSCPLVVGDRVIVNAGGRSNAGIVALSMNDGSTIWSATDADASYASPVLVPNASKAMVLVSTRLHAYVLELDSGKIVGQVPFGMRGPTVNAATPLFAGKNQYFLTASYGIGSLLVEIDENGVRAKKKGQEIASQYASPVWIGDCIYGSDGREDTGSGSYKCIRISTGELLWEKTGTSIAHSIVVENNRLPRILVVGIDGNLSCLKPNPAKFELEWETKPIPGVFRALPAFDGNQLLLRNSSGAKLQWSCVELSSSN